MLDKKDKLELEKIARLKGKSLSATVRELLREQIITYPQSNADKAASFLKKLADNAVEGPGNDDYDSYAYDY